MTRNTFEYEIEGKIYDSPDDARNHVRKSAFKSGIRYKQQ
jgi:hypothetical protein